VLCTVLLGHRGFSLPALKNCGLLHRCGQSGSTIAKIAVALLYPLRLVLHNFSVPGLKKTRITFPHRT
jgi:hypothetical protein